jgi:hypothetical protein
MLEAGGIRERRGHDVAGSGGARPGLESAIFKHHDLSYEPGGGGERRLARLTPGGSEA